MWEGKEAFGCWLSDMANPCTGHNLTSQLEPVCTLPSKKLLDYFSEYTELKPESHLPKRKTQDVRNISWIINCIPMLSQATAFITPVKSHFSFAAYVNTMYSKPSKQNYRVWKGQTSWTVKGCVRLDILQVKRWVKYIWQTCWLLMTPLAFATFCKSISSQRTIRINRKSYSERSLKTQRWSLKYFSHLTILPPPVVWHNDLEGCICFPLIVLLIYLGQMWIVVENITELYSNYGCLMFTVPSFFYSFHYFF